MRPINRIRILLVSAAFLFSILGPREAFTEKVNISGLDPTLAQEMTKFAERKMHELHSPGLGVGVAFGHTLVYEGYFGVTSMDTGGPVNEGTLAMIMDRQHAFDPRQAGYGFWTYG